MCSDPMVLTKRGRQNISERANKLVDELLRELEDDSMVDTSMLLANGLDHDDVPFQIQIKITRDETDFVSAGFGEVEL